MEIVLDDYQGSRSSFHTIFVYDKLETKIMVAEKVWWECCMGFDFGEDVRFYTIVELNGENVQKFLSTFNKGKKFKSTIKKLFARNDEAYRHAMSRVNYVDRELERSMTDDNKEFYRKTIGGGFFGRVVSEEQPEKGIIRYSVRPDMDGFVKTLIPVAMQNVDLKKDSYVRNEEPIDKFMAYCLARSIVFDIYIKDDSKIYAG